MSAVLPPIMRLPPEILADIFIRCIPVSIGRLKPHIWINIPKVCSLWRSVALGCPEFWSTLILSRPKSTAVFLARAKVAPLVIRADVKKLDSNKALSAGFPSLKTILLDNISQLGTFEFRASGDRLVEVLYDLDLSDLAAPRLQCLKIVNTDRDEGLWLPRNLFRRSGDSTKSDTRAELCFHFDGCAFSWDSAWYSHITHLHLEHITSALRPTMEALLGVLVCSPSLQTLSLIHCCPTTSEGFPVDLPHLSALTIRSTDSMCARILKYLVIPPSATLNIICNLKTFLDNDATMASLIFNFCCASPTTYDTVRIIHKDCFAYALLDSARPWWSRRFRIDGKSCQPYPTLCAATRTLITTLDFSQVTTLHLHGLQGALPPKNPLYGATTPTMWLVLGHALHSVRVLHMHRTVPAEFFDFLLTEAMFILGITHWNYDAYGFSRRGEDGRLMHAWGGLQRLALHGLDIGEIQPRKWLDPMAVTRSEMLRALLWARREGGARIWQLEIEDCRNVLSQDLRHFKLFADVEYDGKGSKMMETDAGYTSLRAYSIDVLARMVERDEGYRSEVDSV
ncbi:hypothetical protein B0H12DRAFT_1141409 [Mycena haematopus]|nr:hypothetical protein B0H12DRAFT_1141409 [Mycena haematopus]